MNEKWTRVSPGFGLGLTVAVVVAVGVAIVVGARLLASESSDRSPASGTGARENPAPQVTMQAFDGGQIVVPDDYEGTPLILNFWASWCPFCIAEVPDFEKVQQDVKGQVAFLGVNLRDNREAAEDLAHETHVTYPLAEDPQGVVYEAFGGTGMPTSVFIDGEGSVADTVTGQIFEDQLREMINRNFGVDASG
jgi:cytochrome c biogenesis protein CcmG/thiol:disulfide interchange protein DsbE